MKFEKTIITSYQKGLHLYHIVAEGTNEDIGYELGCLAKDGHNIDKSAVYYPPAITSTRRGYISRNLDFSIPKDFKHEKPIFPFKHTYILEMYPDSCYSFDKAIFDLKDCNSYRFFTQHKSGLIFHDETSSRLLK